jgi:hypothetical protein
VDSEVTRGRACCEAPATFGRFWCETRGVDSEVTRGRAWCEAPATFGRFWCETRGVDSEVTRGRAWEEADAFATGMAPVLVRGAAPLAPSAFAPTAFP